MTRSRGSAVAAGVAAVALCSGLGWWWTESKAQDRIERSAPGLVSAKADQESKTHYPDNVLARNAALAPLDQRRFNQYIVAAASRGELKGEPLKRAMAQLAKLGWRDTSSLQNQIFYHANRGEIGLTLDNVDAMLRRDKLADDVLAALSVAETDPKFRKVLVERMQRGASWTSRFLRFDALLSRPANAAARAETLKALVGAKTPIGRQDIGPSLWRIVMADNRAGAYAIWSQWRGKTAAANPRGFDHDFRIASAQPYEQRELAVPFEWVFASGPGYRASVEGSDLGSSLNINWNGRGAPVFVQRLFKSPDGPWGLHVDGLDLTPISLKNIRFLVECPGQPAIDLTVRSVDMKKGVLMVPQKAPGCTYPALTLRGQTTEAGGGGKNWTIYDMSFVRLSTS